MTESMIITGAQLQRLYDAKVFKGIREYTVASIKLDGTTRYKVTSPSPRLWARIDKALSPE